MRNNPGRSFIPALLFFLAVLTGLQAEDRFPRPEFQSTYQIPSPATPGPREFIFSLLDLGVLIALLSLTAYFVLRKRSRNGVIACTIVSLLYLGFFRKGCICSVGSLQNVFLSFVSPDYTIPVIALLFFVVPLIFTLFFGRVFCGGVCPLGAIQDLVLVKPVLTPSWLNETLSIVPVFYLGIALLSVFTGSGFLICRFDPFVGLFRLSAPLEMLIYGAIMLGISLFINRPYCRFLCPYGVLHNLLSRFSLMHLTTTPDDCLVCNLCSDVCPIDAMDKPVTEKEAARSGSQLRRIIMLVLLVPLLASGGALLGGLAAPVLSKLNPDVRLSEQVLYEDAIGKPALTLESKAFRGTGKPLAQLLDETKKIRDAFFIGSIILGLFLGFVLGIRFIRYSYVTKNEIYSPNKARCVSCGRCIEACPKDRNRIKLNQQKRNINENPAGK